MKSKQKETNWLDLESTGGEHDDKHDVEDGVDELQLTFYRLRDHPWHSFDRDDGQGGCGGIDESQTRSFMH